MFGRMGTMSGHGWLDLRSSASKTRKFVYDAQMERVRPVRRRAWGRRSLRWAVLAVALAASAFGFEVARAATQPSPVTAR